MVLFLVGGLLLRTRTSYGTYANAKNVGIQGGPAEAVLINSTRPASLSNSDRRPGGGAKLLAANYLLTPPSQMPSVAEKPAWNPVANVAAAGTSYIFQKGDTLNKIAARFGVAAEQISAANPSIKRRSPRRGQEIIIPFGDGAQVAAADGDTIELVASRYGVEISDLAAVNPNVNINVLEPGARLIIPKLTAGGAGLLSVSAKKEPKLPNFFMKPAEGFNWGKIHNHNAVDIANSCGTAVVAAAGGIIVPDSNFGDGTGDWNGGYGHFVFIEHSNGVKTRYAHLDKISVEVGDIVSRGQKIGTMGQTGETSGCHVHFEVWGAENPFGK